MDSILLETRQAFAAWRATGRKRFNKGLREQAVKCLEFCNCRQLSEALGVTTKTIRNWERTLSKPGNNAATAMDLTFLPLKLSNSDAAMASTSVGPIRLGLSNGISIYLEKQDCNAVIDFVVALHKEVG